MLINNTRHAEVAYSLAPRLVLAYAAGTYTELPLPRGYVVVFCGERNYTRAYPCTYVDGEKEVCAAAEFPRRRVSEFRVRADNVVRSRRY